MKSAMLLTGIMLLVACGRDQTQTTPTRAFQQEGVTFKLEPQRAADCEAPGPRYRGTVQWAVPAADKIDLELRLRAPDGQVFLGTDQASGSQQTGNWVEPGLWFLLLDHRKNEIVAALQAGPSPCQ